MSAARLRNSQLVKKFQAPTEEQTRLLNDNTRSSDVGETSTDALVRFPFFAPFLSCHSPTVAAPDTYEKNSQSTLSKAKSESRPDSPYEMRGEIRDHQIQTVSVGIANTATSSVASTNSSSRITCAPSTVIVATSTSATCSSVPSRNDSRSSSLMTCTPSTANIFTECHTVPRHDFLRGEPKKNVLQLFGDFDHKQLTEERRNRGHANTSPKRQTWKLSPFLQTRTKKGDNHKKNQTRMTSQPLQQCRGAPIDLDEVSMDESCDDIDTGDYSDPTDADVRYTILHRARDTEPSFRMGQSTLVHKGMDNERVLSQLGMDVPKEDYCIEGEYGKRQYYNNQGHRRVGSGRWKYHPTKSNMYDTSKIVTETTKRENSLRCRCMKLTENLKGSMKKMKNIKILDDDNRHETDIGACKKHTRANDKPSCNILSILRSYRDASSIPQHITITPTSSEDPEMSMTNDELELAYKWQKARARCREGQSPTGSLGVVTPDVTIRNVKSHVRDNSEGVSIATAHVDNRKQPYLDELGHGKDYSF